MEAAGFSEMLVYCPTLCHMPEDSNRSHYCQNLLFYVDTTSYHNIDILIWKLWLQHETEGAHSPHFGINSLMCLHD
jgi:hypothetical protein